MPWSGAHNSELVVLTERAQREPLRTFVQQLRLLHFTPHVVRTVSYRETNDLPTPAAVFVDVLSRDITVAGSIPNQIRATWEYVPVILVANAEDVDRIRFGPQLQDFIAIPIKLPELDARIRFAMWKTNAVHTSRDLIEAGELRMNVSTYEVWARGEKIDLTYKEFELLKYFLIHPRRVFTRAELLEKVWEMDFYGGTRTVDVHIRRLRAKLGLAGDLIHTVRNVGYRFS